MPGKKIKKVFTVAGVLFCFALLLVAIPKDAGAAQVVYNGETGYYYNDAGVNDASFKGVIENPSDGYLYFIKNGVVDSAYTGLKKYKVDGNKYYFKNGVCKKKFTGIVEGKKGLCYVKNGKYMSSYSGTVKYKGRKYTVKDGKATVKIGKVVFTGDSLMIGTYGYIDVSGSKSKITQYAGTQTYFSAKCFEDSSKTCISKLLSSGADRVYIGLGNNDLSWQSTDGYISYYKKIVTQLQKKNPNCDIIILSVEPKAKSKTGGWRNVGSYNNALKKMAKSLGVEYFDWSAGLGDSSGYLKSAYNGGDGIHMNPTGYKIMAKAIEEYDKARNNTLY